MDVPFIALTPEEIEQAYQFFARFGEGPREYDAPDQPTCKGHHGVTFFHDFGKDAESATNAVLVFFAEVYRFPRGIVLRTKELQ